MLSIRPRLMSAAFLATILYGQIRSRTAQTFGDSAALECWISTPEKVVVRLAGGEGLGAGNPPFGTCGGLRIKPEHLHKTNGLEL